MSYKRRIQIAAVLAVFIHLSGVAVWRYVPAPAPPRAAPAPEPIEIDLRPEAPAPTEPVQLVDVAVPSPAPPTPVPLIAEEHAEAMDEVVQENERPAPRLTPDDFDQLAALPAPPTEPAPMPEPPSERALEERPSEIEAPEPDLYDMEDYLEEILEGAQDSAAPAPTREEPLRIAQADPLLPQRPSPGKSRDQQGAAREGVTNFQAIQSEIAPYLKHVRALVEKEWNEMLYTRYSGTSPVKAVIDCAISPSGHLVSVSVVGTENDRLYSALCKDAVQRAGPFGPFPFEVPDIYRDKNLEIRWTFSFL